MEAESGAGQEGSDVDRPPSVPDHLWESIPHDMRKKFVEEAARDLRRGIHPMESVSRMLKDSGIDRQPIKAPPMRRMQPLSSLSRTPPPPAPKPAAAPQPVTAQIPDEPQVAVSAPIAPYGMPVPKAGIVPRGVIGVAIHKEMRLSGPPGKAAAEAEASVFAAIIADPVMAFSYPEGLRSFGARIPRPTAVAIAPLVRQEADRVIEDIRRRALEGDPRVADWIDPDNWHHLREDDDAPPAARR